MGVVQYIDTAAPELQLIECALYAISSKADRGDILSSTIKNPHIAHPYPRQKSQTGGTGPKGHFSVGPQRGRKDFSLKCIRVFKVPCESGKSEMNEPARGGLKPLHSILSLDGKLHFKFILNLEPLKLFTVCNASTL